MKLGGNEYAAQLVSRCEAYLTNTGSVLWGQYWDVSDPEQRKDAAVWLAETIDGVAAVVVKEATVTRVVRPGEIGAVSTNGKKRKPRCHQLKSKYSKIECEQTYGHKGNHAGRGAKGRWYTWE